MKRYWRIHDVYDDEIWRKRQLLPEATRHEAILRESISPWKRGWKRMTRGLGCVKTGQETRNAGGKRSELRWNWSSVIFSNKRTIFLYLRSPASFFRYPFYNIIKKEKKRRGKRRRKSSFDFDYAIPFVYQFERQYLYSTGGRPPRNLFVTAHDRSFCVDSFKNREAPLSFLPRTFSRLDIRRSSPPCFF